jgi:hypothetical protein
MTGQGPSGRETGGAELDGTAASGVEQPTQAAELKVTVGHATAGGRVPQGDAHHFITVSGIAWCVGIAIAGVVLTLQIVGRAPHSGWAALPLAELGLGLAGAVLTAACGRRGARPPEAEGQRADRHVTGTGRTSDRRSPDRR